MKIKHPALAQLLADQAAAEHRLAVVRAHLLPLLLEQAGLEAELRVHKKYAGALAEAVSKRSRAAIIAQQGETP